MFDFSGILPEFNLHMAYHGLRTPNEGINLRYLKFWADVADEIHFGHAYEFGIGI